MGVPMGAAGFPTSVPLSVQVVAVGVTAVLSSAPCPGRDVTAGIVGVSGVTRDVSGVTVGASGVTTAVAATSGVTSPGALYTWALTTAKSSTRSRFAALGSSVGGGRRTWGGGHDKKYGVRSDLPGRNTPPGANSPALGANNFW